MSRYRVIADHQASYPDPIRLKAGEQIKLTRRRDIWDGHLWLWAISPDGREGWIPDTALSPDKRAQYDYCAVEISCRIGDTLTGLHATHGWLWCRTRSGDKGWVPLKNLQPLGH